MAPPVALRSMPWWFSPRVLVLGGLLPVYVGLWAAAEVFGLKISTARGFSFLHGEAFVMGLVALVAFGYGTLLPLDVLAIRDERRRHLCPPAWYMYSLGALAVVGYTWWFRDLAANPRILLDALRPDTAFSYQIRSSIDRSAGIGSLATLGLAYFVLHAHRTLVMREPAPLAANVLAATLLVLTVFRAFAWAERLALIEVGVVVVLYAFGHAERTRRGLLGRLRGVLPVAMVAGVVGFFGLAEYFRSWTSFYSHQEESFWGFIFQRLLNYYFQALNTGAGMITVLDYPSWQFVHTLDWLHRFPLILGPIFRYLVEVEPTFYLERFGDPEFNNPSGLFGVLYDVGLAPAIALLGVTGVLAQSAYRAFRDPGNVLGMFFPIFYLTVIEFFRYWYLGNSRAFLFFFALVLGAMLARRREPIPSAGRPAASPGFRRAIPSPR